MTILRRARNIRAEDLELKKGPSNNCYIYNSSAISKSHQEYSVIYCLLNNLLLGRANREDSRGCQIDWKII